MADDDLSWRDSMQRELAAAHARLDSQGREIGDIKTSLRGVDEKLTQLIDRRPSALPFWVLGGVLATLLTILGLVVTPLYSGHERTLQGYAALAEKLHKHDDGHPRWVKRDLDSIDRRLNDKIHSVDKLHADEHREQEQDIEQLRQRDMIFEGRLDELEQSRAHLETLAEERTLRFQSRIKDKAGDRWTGSQQRVFEHGLDIFHDSLERRISRLEQEQTE